MPTKSYHLQALNGDALGQAFLNKGTAFDFYYLAELKEGDPSTVGTVRGLFRPHLTQFDESGITVIHGFVLTPGEQPDNPHAEDATILWSSIEPGNRKIIF